MTLISAAKVPDTAEAVDADSALRAIGFHIAALTSLERAALQSFPGGSPIDRDVRWMLRAGIQCKLLAARLAREATDGPLQARGRVAEARDLIQMVDGALGRVAMSVAACPDHQMADAQEAQARFVGARHDLDAQHNKYRFLDAVPGGVDQAPSWGEGVDQALLQWSVVLAQLRPVVRRDPDGIPVLRRAAEDVFVRSLDAGAEARTAFRRSYEALLREGRGDLRVQARESWRALLTGDLGGERVRARRAQWLARWVRSPMFVPGLRIAVVVGLFASAAAGVYVNFVRPATQYQDLAAMPLHELAPELERGHIVQRDDGGDLFFGQLSATRERLAPERAPEMIQRMRRLLAPLGVREIVLVDRNNAPFANARVAPEAPAAGSGR